MCTPSWKPADLFAKCVTNRTSDTSSRWYSLERWGFETQGDGFNSTVTSDSTNSNNEAVDLTGTPFNGNTVPDKITTEPSRADSSASVPVAVVVGTAGGAAAFVALSLIVVVILMKKVKQQRKLIEITREEIDEVLLGVPRHKANAKGMNDLFVLPYDTNLEIPKSDVIFCKQCITNNT